MGKCKGLVRAQELKVKAKKHQDSEAKRKAKQQQRRCNTHQQEAPQEQTLQYDTRLQDAPQEAAADQGADDTTVLTASSEGMMNVPDHNDQGDQNIDLELHADSGVVLDGDGESGDDGPSVYHDTIEYMNGYINYSQHANREGKAVDYTDVSCQTDAKQHVEYKQVGCQTDLNAHAQDNEDQEDPDSQGNKSVATSTHFLHLRDPEPAVERRGSTVEAPQAVNPDVATNVAEQDLSAPDVTAYFTAFYNSTHGTTRHWSAVELYGRGWRWHNSLEIWLSKGEMMVPILLSPHHERGYYTMWDVENERLERRELTLYYADIAMSPPGL